MKQRDGGTTSKPVEPFIIDGKAMPIWEVDCVICGKRLTQREYYRTPRGCLGGTEAARVGEGDEVRVWEEMSDAAVL